MLLRRLVPAGGMRNEFKHKKLLKTGGLSFHPNPAKDHLHVTIIDSGELRIINKLGETLFMENISESSNLNIPTSNWNSGMYFLIYRKPNGEINTSKFLITN
mgnify:CR=1 FL=1